MKKLLCVFYAFAVIAGCAVISKEGLKEVNRDITMNMVQSSPDKYIGQKVVWGGIILSVNNREGFSEIEVLETSLAFDYRPKNGSSKGRFLIVSERFFDSNIYQKDKRITASGVIKGIEVRKIGKSDYPYPVITPVEIKLSEPPPPAPSYYDTYPYGQWGPWGPWGPYYPGYPGPWPGPYPYRHPYPYYPYPYFPYP